ncbi:unnamed protein product, partial [Closterium sp. Naga37s-1]
AQAQAQAQGPPLPLVLPESPSRASACGKGNQPYVWRGLLKGAKSDGGGERAVI